MKLNLHTRLLIGHVLPVLILVPVVGIALIFLLENQVILPTLANEMIEQGTVIARLVQNNPRVWRDPAEAQRFLRALEFRRPTQVGLFTPEYLLLASNQTEDDVAGSAIAITLGQGSSNGDPTWAVTADDQGEQVLGVVVPVTTPDGNVIGLVRIYRRLSDIEQGFVATRYLILAVLLVGLIFSSLIAVFLAESFNQPIKRLAGAISTAPLEGKAEALPENGVEEIRSLTRAYNRLQEKRLGLEQDRQQMVANIIHEMGRPLGSMRTAVHALQSGAVEKPELRSDLLQGMTERIDHLRRLLEDLALSYRQLAPQELHLQPVDLREWLKPLIPLWDQSARQRSQTWESHVARDLPVTTTDPDRLAQVLDNLVSNAVKFTQEGGRVVLEVHKLGGEVLFEVSDNGPGIPLEDQPHLFTPFFRSVQPAWKAPGLGLGLSIANSIIASLGGWISFTSRPGSGSRFIVHHPVEQQGLVSGEVIERPS